MKKIILVLITLSLWGCSSHPAIQVSNICDVLDEQPSWYSSVKKSEKKWGVPKSLQLAFIYQESHFASDAKPPQASIFDIFSWGKSSSAYGFAQAKDATWDWYKQKTKRSSAYRDNFADATDFIGWYVSYHHRKLNLPKNDAYRQYLAYHEGGGGYKRGTYRNKAWLVKVAKSVNQTANKYKKQIRQCQSTLENSSGWSIF